MSKIFNQIDYYLKDDSSNYAILINGNWGSGKTFWWKKTIENHIENDGKKCIYISLNGISSEDDIDKEIFFECMNKSDNGLCGNFRKIRESKLLSIGKTILRATGKIDDSKIDYEKLIDLSDIVLCFDDLERVNMPIDRALGYINRFVEHEGVKTFVIANEEEIINKEINNNIAHKYEVTLKLIELENKHKKEEDKIEKKYIEEKMDEFFKNNSNYYKIKEKVIGRTIKYNLNIKELSKNFINIYEGDYKKLVNDNLLNILTINSDGKINIRVLTQSLNEFNQIYKIIESADIKAILEKDSKLIADLFKFYVLISINLKAGKIKDTDLDIVKTKIYNEKSVKFSFYPNQIKEFEDFIDKYYFESDCFYVKEMVRFILEGDIDVETLKLELEQLIEYKHPKEKTAVELTPYQKLEDFRFLEDEEIKSNVEILKKECMSDKNILGILKKISLLFYLYQQKVIDIGLSKFKSEIINVLKAKDNLEFFKDIDEITIKDEANVDDLYLEVYRLAKTKYAELLSKSLDIALDVDKKLDEIIKDIKEYHNKNKYKPIFIHIDSRKLAEKILAGDNKELNNFINIIKCIYIQFSNIRDYYYEDASSLKELYGCLKCELNENENEYGIRKSNLRLLCFYIKDIYEKLE